MIFITKHKKVNIPKLIVIQNIAGLLNIFNIAIPKFVFFKSSNVNQTIPNVKNGIILVNIIFNTSNVIFFILFLFLLFLSYNLFIIYVFSINLALFFLYKFLNIFLFIYILTSFIIVQIITLIMI